MKQIVQNLGNGNTSLLDVPTPNCKNRHVLVRTNTSLVSLGTEKMLVEFGKASLVSKARKQPDKVKLVLNKASTDGIVATLDSVKSKLNQPIPMGYCAAGVVLESIESGFVVGDRVVTNGPHAEMSCISRNLVAKLPDTVSFKQAVFTPVAAIGLQGIRLAEPQIGETVVVMGLGLIGLLVVQMLVGQGCRVIGLDFDDNKLRLAGSYGATVVSLKVNPNPISAVAGLNDGEEVDAVIVAASTASSDPISHAAQMLRKRGRIVLVGVTGLNLNRSDFYEKELTFQVSCSYGPGRYDENYEQQGNDYPKGFVRWTEKRNFDAVLHMMATGVLNTDELVSQEANFLEADKVYEQLGENDAALGIVLQYDESRSSEELLKRAIRLTKENSVDEYQGSVSAAMIGAGNYASRVLIPAIKKTEARLKTIASAGGMSAAHHGIVHGFDQATTEIDNVLGDESINLVFIATRHDSHARFVCDALEAGKHVFVEKPLAITHNELDLIEKTWNSLAPDSNQKIMVGFNRRFAPQVVTMKRMLNDINEPKCLNFVMNAGQIPSSSWVHSTSEGGGRIIGEACHHIDLMRFLVGSPISSVVARSIGKADSSGVSDDKAAIITSFEDGSMGTINYFANGHNSYSKERFDIFVAGRILQLDNFRKLKSYGWPGFKGQNLLRQNKGQSECVAAFVSSIANGTPSPISMTELIEVSRATIEAAELIRAG